MASRMLSQFSRTMSMRRFSSAMAVPLTEAPPYLPEISLTTPVSPNTAPVQVSKLANGVTVASRETSSPYASIGVFIKSGSRSEEYTQRGITHLLGNTVFLSTVDKSGFTINRELDHVGVKFSSNHTREFVTLNAFLPKGTEDVVVGTFGSLLSSPALYHWEIRDEYPRVSLIKDLAQSEPKTVVMENIHKFSFRSGLSNPLYCPSYNSNKFDSNALRDFIKSWYIGQNTSIVGVGVNHEELVRLATKGFAALPDLLPRFIPKAEYVGGGEVRIDAGVASVHAAVMGKGAGTGNAKDLLTSLVLQRILGERQYIKWGSGTATSRVNKAVASAVDAPFDINAVNLNYSDNGLFGMYAVAHGKNIRQVLKSAVSEFAEVAKGNFTATDLTRAKNQLKTAVFSGIQSQSCDVASIAQQVAFTGSYTDFNEAAIDSITAQDVNTFAKMVFAARPNLVVYGNLCDAPRLDELLAGITLK